MRETHKDYGARQNTETQAIKTTNRPRGGLGGSHGKILLVPRQTSLSLKPRSSYSRFAAATNHYLQPAPIFPPWAMARGKRSQWILSWLLLPCRGAVLLSSAAQHLSNEPLAPMTFHGHLLNNNIFSGSYLLTSLRSWPPRTTNSVLSWPVGRTNSVFSGPFRLTTRILWGPFRLANSVDSQDARSPNSLLSGRYELTNSLFSGPLRSRPGLGAVTSSGRSSDVIRQAIHPIFCPPGKSFISCYPPNFTPVDDHSSPIGAIYPTNRISGLPSVVNNVDTKTC